MPHIALGNTSSPLQIHHFAGRFLIRNGKFEIKMAKWKQQAATIRSAELRPSIVI